MRGFAAPKLTNARGLSGKTRAYSLRVGYVSSFLPPELVHTPPLPQPEYRRPPRMKRTRSGAPAAARAPGLVRNVLPRTEAGGSPRRPARPGEGEAFRRRVYGWIRRIPRGRVATYGQIAALAGAPRRARMVGQALAALPLRAEGRDVPWHRVINSQGRISLRGGEYGARRGKRPRREDGAMPETRQQRLLEAEGVRFQNGRVDLGRYRWDPALERAWTGARAP